MPGASVIVVPGAATSSAFWMVLKGAPAVVPLLVSSPVGLTYKVEPCVCAFAGAGAPMRNGAIRLTMISPATTNARAPRAELATIKDLPRVQRPCYGHSTRIQIDNLSSSPGDRTGNAYGHSP